VVEIVVRPGYPADSGNELVQVMSQVPWPSLSHAYGPAIDLPALLYAVVAGAGETRPDAWWELWGNVHHQGTVYEATVRAVPFIGLVATAADHPDRVEAIAFLRAIALGDGSYKLTVRDAVRPLAQSLATASRNESQLVQRAILWLISAFPELLPSYQDLCILIPEPMRSTWDEVLEANTARIAGRDENADEPSDEVMDRIDTMERWALDGWTETG